MQPDTSLHTIQTENYYLETTLLAAKSYSLKIFNHSWTSKKKIINTDMNVAPKRANNIR